MSSTIHYIAKFFNQVRVQFDLPGHNGKGKVCWAIARAIELAHQAGACPSFHSIKCLRSSAPTVERYHKYQNSTVCVG